MVTYKQIAGKSMTPEKKESSKIDLVGYYVGRKLSYWATIPFLNAGMAPTTVTKLSAVFVLAAVPVFLVSKTLFGFLIGWLLIQIWNILDGVDGNIARYTDTTSPMGGLWDASTGWLATVVFYVAMGFAAFRLGGVLGDNFLREQYTFLGCFSGLCWIFPRLIMHKKIGLLGSDQVSSVRNHGSYGFAKLCVFNLTSINGLGAIVFLIAMLCGLCDVCLLFYTVISVLMAVVSCVSLLFK